MQNKLVSFSDSGEVGANASLFEHKEKTAHGPVQVYRGLHFPTQTGKVTFSLFQTLIQIITGTATPFPPTPTPAVSVLLLTLFQAKERKRGDITSISTNNAICYTICQDTWESWYPIHGCKTSSLKSSFAA